MQSGCTVWYLPIVFAFCLPVYGMGDLESSERSSFFWRERKRWRYLDLSFTCAVFAHRPSWLSSSCMDLQPQGQHKRPITTHNSETSFYFSAMDMLTIKGDMARLPKNIHASELARRRWSKVPKNERAKQVPRSGGRPRKYPKCPRYGSHRFSPGTGRCPCGFSRPVHR